MSDSRGFENWACGTCGTRELLITCRDTGTWLIRCANLHEVAPLAAVTIRIQVTSD